MHGHARLCMQDRLLGDPDVNVAHQVVGLCGGEEDPRRDETVIAVAQPDEQLMIDDLAGGDLDDRLGVQDEAVFLEPFADACGPGLSLGLVAQPLLVG